eukprot:3932532-Prymnesium_polylepis.1
MRSVQWHPCLSVPHKHFTVPQHAWKMCRRHNIMHTPPRAAVAAPRRVRGSEAASSEGATAPAASSGGAGDAEARRRALVEVLAQL